MVRPDPLTPTQVNIIIQIATDIEKIRFILNRLVAGVKQDIDGTSIPLTAADIVALQQAIATVLTDLKNQAAIV